MRYTTIPGTELAPSCLGLGLANIGTRGIDENPFLLLDAFVEQGGNFFDTARVYSDWVAGEHHRSERILGDWLRERGNREQIIIGTKGGHPDLDAMQVSRLTREEIVRDLEGSLKTLGTDYIDLYWLHRDDPRVPVSTIIDLLHELQSTGKIRHYACSNWNPSRIQEANTYAASQCREGFVANQLRWNLAIAQGRPATDSTIQRMDEESLRFHKNSRLCAIPFGSQAGGFFSKLLDCPALVSDTPLHTSQNLKIANLLQAVANDAELSISQVQLAYLWSHDFDVIPLVGCRTSAQLRDSLGAVGHRLSGEIIERLEALIRSS